MSPNPTKPSTPSCPQCGLRYQCVCIHTPKLEINAHIALLTHPNELKRATNTGKLLSHSLSNCEVHVWDRVNPPAKLLEQIPQQATYLLFPSEQAIDLDTIKSKPLTGSALFIILDGTWQEAKKMLNKSPWLQALPKVSLSAAQLSSYSLRRNQTQGNLCTCEVGINLLQQLNPKQDLSTLQQYFELFLKMYEADREHRVFESRE
ncbi:tRNA-uridine aminocarboxypropyltransferase [Vibrio gangliei]|uniref:tRNA-uridine aminocarboxypropyltransferase n=1 Tax=Vibrio gangliei TaxID=2077090 RepID=UPI000D014BB0|nr:DTW domain-containing protein [Vibrio gangliei]